MTTNPTSFTHLCDYVYCLDDYIEVPDTVYFNADDLRRIWSEVRPVLDSNPDILSVRLKATIPFLTYTAAPDDEEHEPCHGWTSAPMLQISPRSAWLLLIDNAGSVAEALLMNFDSEPTPNPNYLKI